MSIKNWLNNHLANYKSIQHGSQPGWVKKYLRHPYLWHFTYESVARGVAVGFFTGIIPILPFQTLLAITIAILIRANLPVALLASWISNPITILPLAYFTYYVGSLTLNGTLDPNIEFAWQMDNFKDAWATFGVPFFVGLPIVAFGAGLFGYFSVKLTEYVNRIFHIKK